MLILVARDSYQPFSEIGKQTKRSFKRFDAGFTIGEPN
tara:strand:+ start:1970 stop:2083 length:114 start_codon:yes stop_codon:yes gene_type:complete